MIRQLIFSVTCLALFSLACKSGNKDATEESTQDSITVMNSPYATGDSASQANHSMSNNTTSNNSTSSNTMSGNSGSTQQGTSNNNDVNDPDEKGFYRHPAKAAAFPGGEAALNKFLNDNLQYPAAARKEGLTGTVQASLSVDEKGNILTVEIISPPLGFGLEEEVLRVIQSMPKWNPGESQNKAVKTKFVVPVVFKLK